MRTWLTDLSRVSGVLAILVSAEGLPAVSTRILSWAAAAITVGTKMGKTLDRVDTLDKLRPGCHTY